MLVQTGRYWRINDGKTNTKHQLPAEHAPGEGAFAVTFGFRKTTGMQREYLSPGNI